MKLQFAIPSKGRLAEGSVNWLNSCDIEVVNPAPNRGYSGQLKGSLEAELSLLSTSEIPGKLADGSVHFAITGMDVVQENIPQWQTLVTEVLPLGFGFADLVVSVPRFWIDAETTDDLDKIAAQFRFNHNRRLRIATKYTHLVREFLSEAGVADYQLVYSKGATEGSVANNFADAVADLVSSGKTLDANDLKPLQNGVVLRSQATLFQSVNCLADASAQMSIDRFLNNLELNKTKSAN